MRARSSAAFAFFAALCAVGCREAAAPPPSFTTRDSAGVRIVEHASFDALPARRAADAAEITIGTSPDDPAQQLDRVVGATVLSGGRIVLLNAGTSEVRFYDGAGALAATQGRPGEGPGEYRAAASLFTMPGDSVLVWDVATRRGTVVGADAAAGRSITLDGEGARFPAGVFPSGELLVVERVAVMPDPSQMLGIVSDDQRDHVYSAAGQPTATLGEHPGRTMTLSQGGLPLTGPPRMDAALELGPAPFGAATQRAVAGDGYWLGTQEAREIVSIDRAGAARTVVRWRGAPLTLTDADRNAYVEGRIEAARTEEIRTGLRALELEAFHFPDSLPSHGALVAATDGALWMADYQQSEEAGPARWTVFGPDGIARERVELPEGSSVLWTDGERVLLRLEDELGVQRVELRELEAASGASP